ncbi:MAG TPA: glycosyltransferase family 4 protein [Candidatus Methylomirabilis sp.]|nr:glycosyltransferase family 4 protein [Candidatus Methylomirabilis sp.]
MIDIGRRQSDRPARPVEIAAALLTGGRDPHYALGLATALISRRVCLDVIGSDEMGGREMHAEPRLRFLNLRGDVRPDASLARKVWRVLSYYARLIRYAVNARPRIFHILWNNRLEPFDRTLLMLYYKLLGKTIVFTAHNVNAAQRDARDSLLNRLTLRIQFHLVDHIFVHTKRMKREIIDEFGAQERAVTVIPYGINTVVPDTALTPLEAKQRLGITRDQRTILFFGYIAPYKGLDVLVAAFRHIVATNAAFRLIIAGRVKGGFETYWRDIQETLDESVAPATVIARIRFIPDEEIEVYFKAADVLALPYTRIFQSGVLFLGFRFGLPAIAADVGSLAEDIIEGRTGFLCRPGDPVAMAKVIEAYFASELFRDLDSRRRDIQENMGARHSWDVVGTLTRDVYAELLGHPRWDS